MSYGHTPAPRAPGSIAATVLALGFALGVAGQAAALPPDLTISYGVNSGAASIATLAGSGSNTSALYDTTINGQGGAWTLVYHVIADLKPDSNASLVGTLTFTNHTDIPQSILVSFSLPLCPAIGGGSFVGGTATMTLNSQGAGSLTCGSATELVRVQGDGATLVQVFPCPFNLAATGSGNAGVPTTFGLPGPNIAGPDEIMSIGLSESLTITGQDTAVLSFTILYKDANGLGTPTCPGDINLDGVVNSKDITYLLTQWDSSPPCGGFNADIDGSGLVDATDLSLLLTGWGPCD